MNKEAVQFLGRHFVNLCWIDETPNSVHGKANKGLGKPFTTSGFVISVQGNWFLITAGHILNDIQIAKNKGQILTNFTLNDTWGPNAQYERMPFDFEGSEKRHAVNDKAGIDYGIILLRSNTCDLLTKNGVEPITEQLWKTRFDEYEEYMLLGSPSEFEKVDTYGGLHIQRSLILFDVKRIVEPPKSLATQFTRIYYSIPSPLIDSVTGEPLNDIDGLSGCPLIGIRTENDGKRRYYVIGIQSGWHKEARIAYACPLKALGEWVESGIKR